MRLWRWLVEIFRDRASGTGSEDGQAHLRRKDELDARAANAARVADARLPPH